MRRKQKNRKLIILPLILLVLIALVLWYLSRHTIAVLQPAGEVGRKERNLMLFALGLSAVVVIPVYVMAITIATKYRESNHRTKRIVYKPDWDRSRLFEGLWWGIPLVIITILSIVTWNSSHALDPYKALAASNKPLTVQVVALDWKWLFIYPDQHIASVNLVEMPVNVPVNFQLTSDTVMNSFWIPQLGGQIYAMPGMSTQLHLMADKTGSFYGSPANIAGSGFSRMNFTAKAVSQADFNTWVRSAASGHEALDATSYTALARPSDNYPVTYYSRVTSGLYNAIVMHYMRSTSIPGMDMP